ncbi:MAG: bifunctional DNA primase/polymerase, partial [Ilumatobacteraceae bacterium]
MTIVNSDTHRAAFALANEGRQVLACHGIASGGCTCGRPGCSSPGKHPLLRQGLHDATRDPSTIERWWTRWPDANVGIRTGAVS